MLRRLCHLQIPACAVVPELPVAGGHLDAGRRHRHDLVLGRFHKKYFDDHLPPYNSVAVQLPEGPIVISQLQGPQPEGNWIGREVVFVYAEHAGRMQHHVRLAGEAGLADSAVSHNGPGGDPVQHNGA